MKLRWSPRAERDLYRIGDYIAVDDPRASIRWIGRLRARMRRAAMMPRQGRVVPERRDDRIREVIVGNYRIIYRIDERAVTVIGVFEGHLQLPELD